MQTGFGVVEYTVLVLYVLGSVLFGLWFARRQKSVVSYYLAERNAPSWAVAISLLSSDTTAISYLGVAAWLLTNDLQLAMGTFAYPIAAVCVALVFVPFMAKLKVFTVYEYLEHRFDVGVRTVASLLFMFGRSAHLAVALFAASLAFALVTGVPPWVSLVVLGGLTTLYTVFGGMKAVLWTDVAQFFVLIGGLIAVVIGVSIAFDWNIAKIWSVAANPPPITPPWLGGKVSTGDHTTMFNFHVSFTQLTFWSIVLNSFFYCLASLGSDQVLVQRYLAAGSKKEMTWSLLYASLVSLPLGLVMNASGIFLMAYYHYFYNSPGHEWIQTLTNPNQIIPHYVTHALPGILGAIVIAGLFAGTMSSFSAGLNSLSTAAYVDFFSRFGKKKVESEKAGVFRAKLLTLFWGIVIILAASLAGRQESIFGALSALMSPFLGPLLGMFILGMLSPRVNNFGVISGAIVGVAATYYVTYAESIAGLWKPHLCGIWQPHMHWAWYPIVGWVVAMVAGYVLSFLKPAPDPRKIAHLTFSGINRVTNQGTDAGPASTDRKEDKA